MRFETLREDLLKGGVAPRHIRRYLAELSEHLDDLTAQQRDVGYDAEDAAIRARAKLGSDAELAGAMLGLKQFRSLAARAPWAVFGLLPPLAAMGAFFALMAVLALIANACGMIAHHGINAPHWFRLMVQGAILFGNFVLAPLLAMAFVLSATRQRLWPGWPLLAILLIALLDMQLQVDFPAPGVRGGSLGLGAAIWVSNFDSLVRHWPLALSQLLLTLLPAVLLYGKHRAPV
jgi:hypothetical protein